MAEKQLDTDLGADHCSGATVKVPRSGIAKEGVTLHSWQCARGHGQECGCNLGTFNQLISKRGRVYEWSTKDAQGRKVHKFMKLQLHDMEPPPPFPLPPAMKQSQPPRSSFFEPLDVKGMWLKFVEREKELCQAEEERLQERKLVRICQHRAARAGGNCMEEGKQPSNLPAVRCEHWGCAACMSREKSVVKQREAAAEAGELDCGKSTKPILMGGSASLTWKGAPKQKDRGP